MEVTGNNFYSYPPESPRKDAKDLSDKNTQNAISLKPNLYYENNPSDIACFIFQSSIQPFLNLKNKLKSFKTKKIKKVIGILKEEKNNLQKMIISPSVIPFLQAIADQRHQDLDKFFSGPIPCNHAVQKAALSIALNKRDSESLSILLNHNFNPNEYILDKALISIAIKNGDLKSFNTLIEHRADIGLSNDRMLKTTPLMHALTTKNHAIIESLLQAGADPEKQNLFGQSALHYVMDVDSLRLLFKYFPQLDINARDTFGNTFLSYTVKDSTDIFLVQEAINRGADVNTANPKGCTPLHAAAQAGKEHFIEVLLANKADSAHADANDYTPLFSAIHGEHLDCIKLLTPFCSDLKKAIYSASIWGKIESLRCLHALIGQEAWLSMINSSYYNRDNSYSSILAAAVYSGQKSSVEFLLQTGALLSLGDETNDAIRTALVCRKKEILAHLFQYFNSTEEEDLHLFDIAIENNFSKGARWLIQERKIPSICLQERLLAAVNRGDSKSVENLLKAGVSGQEALADRHALYGAALFGHTLIVMLLLKYGVENSSWQTVDGQTALHIAASRGHNGCVKLLGRDKSNLNLTDKHGRTPLHLACTNLQSQSVRLLASLGADITLKDHYDETPLDIALSLGDCPSVAALLPYVPQLCSKKLELFLRSYQEEKSVIELLLFETYLHLNAGLERHFFNKNLNLKIYQAASLGLEKVVEKLLLQYPSERFDLDKLANIAINNCQPAILRVLLTQNYLCRQPSLALAKLLIADLTTNQGEIFKLFLKQFPKLLIKSIKLVNQDSLVQIANSIINFQKPKAFKLFFVLLNCLVLAKNNNEKSKNKTILFLLNSLFLSTDQIKSLNNDSVKKLFNSPPSAPGISNLLEQLKFELIALPDINQPLERDHHTREIKEVYNKIIGAPLNVFGFFFQEQYILIAHLLNENPNFTFSPEERCYFKRKINNILLDLRHASCIRDPIERLEKTNSIIREIQSHIQVSSLVVNAFRILGMLGVFSSKFPICHIEEELAFWNAHKKQNRPLHDLLFEFERRSSQLICDALTNEQYNSHKLKNLYELHDDMILARQWLVTFGLANALEEDDLEFVYALLNNLQAEFEYLSGNQAYKQIATFGPFLLNRLKKNDTAGKLVQLMYILSAAFMRRNVNYEIIARRLHDLRLPVRVEEVVEALAKAELTINLPGNIFSDTDKLGPRLLNMWHRGFDTGSTYGQTRNQVEIAIFEEKELNPDTRPIYAAANIGKRDIGSASLTYGFSHITLDPAIKFRATYMPTDSFFIVWHFIDDETFDRLKNLPKNEQLSTDQLDYIKSHFYKKVFTEEQFNAFLLENPCSLDEDEMKRIFVHSIISHGAQDSISTLFCLENTIAWLTDQQLGALALSILLPGKKNFEPGNYVETHIHGVVKWGEHVNSAALYEEEILPDEAKTFIETYPKIKISWLKTTDIQQAEDTKESLKFFRKGK